MPDSWAKNLDLSSAKTVSFGALPRTARKLSWYRWKGVCVASAAE